MKAVVKLKKGPEQMAYIDIPRPTAGADDVVIRVEAAGICGSDLRLKRFGNSSGLIPPVVMGHEFSGTISEIGTNISGFTLGERVVSDNSGYLCGVCENCAIGDYMACENRKGLGIGMNGGFAKYVRIPGQVLRVNPCTLFQIPDGISFEEAALMDPIANAYKAVIQEGALLPGQTVVIYGMGTIGLLAVQLARIAGAGRIIAVNRSASSVKFELARMFGADSVIASEMSDVVASILEQTNGHRVPLIVDCAGSNQILEQSLELLQKNGRFVKVGYDRQPIGISFDDYVVKGIQIIGHFAYNYQSWKNCLSLLRTGRLQVKPLITAVLPLEEWEQAFAIAAQSDSVKVILKP